jgi:hypothetical protein
MIGLRTILAVGALAAFGCGRTALDDGLEPAGGLTGTGGSGQGGRGAGGASGGATGTLPCGGTACRTGVEACCTTVGPGGLPEQMCVGANDPSACPNGATLGCIDASGCSPQQSCCFSLATLASACLPTNSCLGGATLVLCGRNADCPRTAPKCCPGQQAGVCVPQGLRCPMP